MSSLSASQKTKIVQLLCERFQPYAITIFGSAAKETLRPDSDIDLAFMAEISPSAYEVFMVAQELADHLKREVDLVDFRQASTVFKTQIIKSGILLLDENRNKRQFEFMRALKEYALLNEERSAIIAKK